MTELELRRKEIEEIELTEDEIKYAILSAKVQKWNKIRNAPYWEALEKKKAKKDDEPVPLDSRQKSR